MTTPQWLEECPLELIPPVDMKTVCVSEGLEEWWIPWLPDEEAKMVKMTKLDLVLVYVEVDKYFECNIV